MNFRKLLYTDIGKNLISVILGIGLASLFQKVCNDKNCLIFNGPIIQEVDGKIFEYNDNCYKYDISAVSCDNEKIIIETSDVLPKHITPSMFNSIQNIKSMWSPSSIEIDAPNTKII